MVSTPIAEQQSIKQLEKNLLSNILPKTPLFGTDGIRGKVGELLTETLALQVGFCAGKVLSQESHNHGVIIIGQDPRNSSEMLAKALASGLTSAGLEVWNLGLCPTPCVAYLTSISEAIGGVMISASHNPPEDNGIKFFGQNGRKLAPTIQKKIENLLRDTAHVNNFNFVEGQIYQREDLITNYEDSLQQSLLDKIDLKGMKIVLDLAWGAVVNIAPEVFKNLGAEVICLHEKPDGDRINVNCGSTHIQVLQKAVQEYNADLGFAFDGDADRVIGVDGKGRIVDGDYILYFWGNYLREKNQLPENLIIATVMANLGFENAWKNQGGKLIRTNVGDQYVQAEMLNTGAILGGEQSGHILCHHYAVSGDGLLTALHLSTLVKKSGQTLAEMVDNSFQTYPQLLRNVRVEDRELRLNWAKNQTLVETITESEQKMGNQGRVLVRASGTEPVIRVMVEAVNQEIVNHHTELLVKAVEEHLL